MMTKEHDGRAAWEMAGWVAINEGHDLSHGMGMVGLVSEGFRE